MSKLQKVLLIVTGVIILLFFLIILFCSPLAKYLVEKYDVEYTGREIEMDWAYLNPFTGYVHFDDLVIFEQDSSKEFISLKGLSANLSIFKLMSKTYEITNVTLNKPYISVIQEDKGFNFTDLIEKFSPDSTKVKSDKIVRFNLLNIKIKNGEFHFDDAETPVDYFINNVNLSSEGLRYDVDTMPIHFAFSSGTGPGDIEGDITINLDNQNYSLAVKIDSFDLDVINQYLKALTNYGTFAARLDAQINSTGNFATVDSISTKGKIKVSDFHFGRSKDEDFASFDQLVIDIIEISPKKFIYHYDSITLKKPFLRYENYDNLDNIQTMFGEGGENVSAVNSDPNKFNLVIEIAKLIEQISKNLLRSHYKSWTICYI